MSNSTNYQALIDQPTWAFIEQTLAFSSSATDEAIASSEKSPVQQQQTNSLDIEKYRRDYANMCTAFYAGRPPTVVCHDESLHGLAVRTYRHRTAPTSGHVIYYHGGGFVVGDLQSHDDVCAELCAATGMTIVALAYALAPEHPHPAAFDDAMRVFHWVSAGTEEAILVAGDSAGAGLAAAVSHHSRGLSKRPQGQLLIYPWLSMEHSLPSRFLHANAPALSMADINGYVQMLGGSEQELCGDSRLFVCADSDFTQLPATIMISADCDPLRDDCMSYLEKLQGASIKALWHNEAGLPHGYLRARHQVPRAASSFQRMIVALKALQEQRFPAQL